MAQQDSADSLISRVVDVPPVDSPNTSALDALAEDGGDNSGIDDDGTVEAEWMREDAASVTFGPPDDDDAPLPPPRRRARLKREIEAENLELQRRVRELESRTQAAVARTDEDAIDRLARTFEMGLSIGFGFAARRRGEHWLLEDDEREGIAHSAALWAAPHATKIEENAPWILVVAQLGAVIHSRMEIDRQIAQKRAEEIGNG